jgi:hypothetical protein
MTDDQRWRRWKIAFAAGIVLSIGAMAVALAAKSVAGVVVVLMLIPVLMLLLLVTLPRRTIPPYLQGLDEEQRHLVAALADSGDRAPDPILADAVVAYARRQRTGHIVVLVSGALPVGFRLSHLLAGAGSARAFDSVVIVVWLVAAGFLGRGLVRSIRAISANR